MACAVSFLGFADSLRVSSSLPGMRVNRDEREKIIKKLVHGGSVLGSFKRVRTRLM